jgi:acyl-coenzyme A thioesterase PaaI-like protein
VSGENKLSQSIIDRIAELHAVAPGSIGDQMHYRLVRWDDEAREYVFSCRTFDWMRNGPGTLHGGMCATVIDQAMGFVAYCAKPGEGIAPTVSMQTSYHRALIPGQDVIVTVRMLSRTRSFMHFTAEAAQESAPEKLCLSGSATYFYKAASI